MSISTGDKLPDGEFMVPTDDGPEKVSVSDTFSGRKVILVGMPGAFTGTCHNTHLPGFIENIDAMREKGVDEVAVTCVNDFFVMGAWAEATKGKGKITYLCDPDASFAKAIGMDIDLSAAGLGIRSKRYVMVVDDGTVVTFKEEPGPGQADVTSAANLLSEL